MVLSSLFGEKLRKMILDFGYWIPDDKGSRFRVQGSRFKVKSEGRKK
jgi:hypothetical protein